MEDTSARWYKLKDESWGVKIRFTGTPGIVVHVTNSKGEQKAVTLAQRAAKFDDAELWSIQEK
jgi:hypothetical protein